jgi:PIN domain nuclease of toxin-antitoxin system
MSAWEVSMLQAKNRISITQDIIPWFDEIMSAYAIDWVELSPKTLVAANALPNLDHKDPVDRILIATARRLDLKILTSDAQIIGYGQRGFVETLEW